MLTITGVIKDIQESDKKGFVGTFGYNAPSEYERSEDVTVQFPVDKEPPPSDVFMQLTGEFNIVKQKDGPPAFWISAYRWVELEMEACLAHENEGKGPMVNAIELTGRTGRAFVLKRVGDSSLFENSIAVGGSKNTEAQWFNFTYWKPSDGQIEYLTTCKPGSVISIKGNLSFDRPFQSKSSGLEIRPVSINARNLQVQYRNTRSSGSYDAPY